MEGEQIMEADIVADESHWVSLRLPQSVAAGEPLHIEVFRRMPKEDMPATLAALEPDKPWAPMEPIPGGKLQKGYSMRRSDWYDADN
jgi:hypothetical protein